MHTCVGLLLTGSCSVTLAPGLASASSCPTVCTLCALANADKETTASNVPAADCVVASSCTVCR